jgi:hypothetical protein
MALVTQGAQWSVRGEDAGSVDSQSYWRDCDTGAEPVASSAAWCTDSISPNLLNFQRRIPVWPSE